MTNHRKIMNPPLSIVIWLSFVLWCPLAVNSADYLGCFKSMVGNSDTTQKVPLPAGFSVDVCMHECQLLHYRYAGIENGQSCICSSFYGTDGPADNCTVQCKDNTMLACGGEGAVSVYMTRQIVSSPPQKLEVVSRDENGMELEWTPPKAPNGIVREYVVKAVPVYSQSAVFLRTVLASREWTFPNTSTRGELVGVEPGTKYNISVAANTDAGMGVPAYKLFWSAIGVPEKPQAPRVLTVDQGKITVRLFSVDPLKGPISAYRVVVIDETYPTTFHEENLKSWSDAHQQRLPYYIAAEFPAGELPDQFIVGDGHNYGGYNNPALPDDHDFHVTLQAISSQDGITKTSIASVSHDQHNQGIVYLGAPTKVRQVIIGDDPAVILGLSIAVGVFGFLLLVSVVIYITLRYYHHQRRRMPLENRELTLQGPMIDIEENGYIHNGLMLEDEGPVDHYDRLRSQVNMLSQTQMNWDCTSFGRGQYGEVYQGNVQLRGHSVPAVIYAVTDNELANTDKKTMLQELDVLMRVGTHNNVIALLGICEEPDILYIVTDHHPVTLKGMLLDSRILSGFPSYSESPLQPRFTTLQEAHMLEVAVGIAQGMDYLSSIKLVHRQLTAQSIVMKDGHLPKITGFGIAQFNRHGQSVHDYTRWTAQEIFRNRLNVSTKGDVWSFGCLLWEIFTLGGTPYPDVKSKDVPLHVMRGQRLPQVSYVDDDLYQLMLQCWQIDLDERPTFGEIASILENLSMESQMHLNFGTFVGFQYERYIPELEVF